MDRTVDAHRDWTVAWRARPAAAIAILVGGRSRRMGRPKAALPLGESTVLERVVASAATLALPIYLVGAHRDSQAAAPDATPAPDAADADLEVLLARLDLPRIRDRHADLGPLAGLDAAFAATDAKRILLLACDLPFLTGDFLAWLLAAAGDAPAAVPADDAGRLHPLCAVYASDCRPALTAALGAQHLRLQGFVRDVGGRVLPAAAWRHLDPEGRLLTNLNEPVDLERAAAWWTARAGTVDRDAGRGPG